MTGVAGVTHTGAEMRDRALGLEASETELELPAVPGHRRLLSYLGRAVAERLDEGVLPIRLAVTSTSESRYRCELGVMRGLPAERSSRAAPIFGFRRRRAENAASFTTVLVVPTGIGASVGGHAGDATPAARLLASVSDTLVTHPNVLNASDVIDLPPNALYVEGSVLARLLMGTLGLAPVRSNRILCVVDAHRDAVFSDHAVNAVSAARASFGLDCPRVVLLDPPLPVESHYAASGRATGGVRELERLFAVLDDCRDEYDAVALSTQIRVDPETRLDYYRSTGDVVNPWGGVEALLTHAISTLYALPAAHSPMLESREIAALPLGILDPRMAAESISLAFFVSVLKGLQRSPRIVPATAPRHDLLTVENVSCLVVPDKVVGLPTLAALEQGIPVVAVRESENLMDNDLRLLPWAPGQLAVVDNYWEAAGVVACLRAGIEPAAVRRPLAHTRVSRAR